MGINFTCAKDLIELIFKYGFVFSNNNDGEFVSLIGVTFSLDIPADYQNKFFCVSVLSYLKYLYF